MLHFHYQVGIMNLTLKEKSRGIKVAWFFMIITIGAFLSEMQDALDSAKNQVGNFDSAYETGYIAGGKLGLITLLGMGMLLYTRTKKGSWDTLFGVQS